MELKGFQKSVLADLKRFLLLLTELGNIRAAYQTLWEEKGVSVGLSGIQPYKTSIQGVPQVCLKVPTGGGKTFIAANSIRPIFDALPHVHPKSVVWLVPSDAILRQTVKTLSDREHPYRQAIDNNFGSRVEVYTKEQLLNGQNFNPISVDENLSVFVLTYDSFRTSNKDGRRAYKQNGNLTAFPNYFDDSDHLLPDTDETALIQVIRSLNPVVIVDESHHAVSKLSVEMLDNFNPCFVLELTATPKAGSNIISIVDAWKLKKEEMVKLPVYVYNQKTQEDVFLTAIELRRRLEEAAKHSEENGGKYLRPIVLFQAQPKTKEDATTYDRIKGLLLRFGIPDEQIAIKTGEKDEIKNTDLMAKTCPIRYIITVNALKEGWDCPFAYILATVANRSSVVDVEQILGRILRMPYASFKKEEHLNLSYVITSSSDFYETTKKVVSGLENAGFSKRDHRIITENEVGVFEVTGIDQVADATQIYMELDSVEHKEIVSESEENTVPDINVDEVRNRLENRSSSDDIISQMMKAAEEESRTYWERSNDAEEDGNTDIPYEVAERMKEYHICSEFQEEAKNTVLPQFMLDDGISYFGNSGKEVLDRAELREGFTLRDKDTMIDFGNVKAEMAKVDIEDRDGAVPKAFQINGRESENMRKWFDIKPSEAKRRLCKDTIIKRITEINAVSQIEIEAYVGRIMDNMTEEQLSDLEQMPELYAKKIKEKVENLLKQHEADTFHKWMRQDKIVCEPNYHLKEKITPATTISNIPKSLYEEEDGDLNDYEKEVIWALSSLDNVRWWHRNIAKREFYINGAVTAYPDLIVRLEDGKTILVETKGDHLDNPESKAKAESGDEWAKAAGRLYKYYMVFQTKDPDYKGACSYEHFMEDIKEL